MERNDRVTDDEKEGKELDSGSFLFLFRCRMEGEEEEEEGFGSTTSLSCSPFYSRENCSCKSSLLCLLR